MPLSLAPEDMLYMYRGVHCEKLTWDEHIETISKKINVGIVAVRHMSRLQLIYKAFIPNFFIIVPLCGIPVGNTSR